MNLITFTLNTKSQAKTETKKPGVLTKGWFKYIIIRPSNDSQNFEENPDFGHESTVLSSAQKNEVDDIGSVSIPDKNSFQMILTETTLNILSSRRNQITKTIDVIDLNGMKQVNISSDAEGNMVFKGGLEVMGTFDEGKCLKLNFKSGQSYVVCSPLTNKVDNLSDQLYRINKAFKTNDHKELEKESKFEANFFMDNKNFDMGEYVKDELAGKSHESELIDIGDWSVCDHVCGGGEQHKFKGCKPPLAGFKCTKKPITLKRSCNTQPCQPGENPNKLDVPDDSWKTKQPSITLPVRLDSRYVSHRFQQYEECQIKDQDLCVRRADLMYKLGMKQAPILPGRGVLNKFTFSFFENTKYDSLHRSYKLSDIVVKPFPLDTNCFEVKSTGDVKDVLVLCGCPFEPSSKDSAVEWIHEIMKFRDYCPTTDTRAISVEGNAHLKMQFGNETVDISGDKLKELAKETLSKKAKDIEQEDEEKEAAKISDAINQVESITTNYTKNEFFKERLIEKEEELKAKKELENLDKLIQKEKEKEKCIETFLDRESRRQKRKQKEREAEQELSEIKKEVETQVKEIKHVFRSKMSKLKQETERIKMEKMKQLTNMKLRITQMLIDQEMKGSISNCKQDKEENKIAYCNARFPSAWFENKQCRMKENFCGVCCEKEFSVRYGDDREKCTYECRLVNGLVSMASNDKLTGTNESATVEIVNNP